MKIRTGFVSNSSASSFLIAYRDKTKSPTEIVKEWLLDLMPCPFRMKWQKEAYYKLLDGYAELLNRGYDSEEGSIDVYPSWDKYCEDRYIDENSEYYDAEYNEPIKQLFKDYGNIIKVNIPYYKPVLDSLGAYVEYIRKRGDETFECKKYKVIFEG